jgi:negative regulator of sigma E activity
LTHENEQGDFAYVSVARQKMIQDRMNCEECKEAISAFMDNELEGPRADAVRMHLALCLDCAKVCEDFSSILDLCESEDSKELIPPNSRALWCRINNIIETEVKTDVAPLPAKKRRWQLSLPQLVSAVLAIAVVSSLVTLVGIRRYSEPRGNDVTLRSSSDQTPFEKIAGKLGFMETPEQARARRYNEQKAVIDYWNNRVQARRAVWDRNVRDAFDRNLNEIDQAVSEYTLILQRDPQDDLSGEMLDSALNEKIDLLREFSDL